MFMNGENPPAVPEPFPGVTRLGKSIVVDKLSNAMRSGQATAISRDICFIHIPKTAGTSVLHAICAGMGVTVESAWTVDPAHIPNSVTEVGHVSAGHIGRFFEPPVVAAGGIFFSLVRDPYRWASSMVRYQVDVWLKRNGNSVDPHMREQLLMEPFDFLYSPFKQSGDDNQGLIANLQCKYLGFAVWRYRRWGNAIDLTDAKQEWSELMRFGVASNGLLDEAMRFLDRPDTVIGTAGAPDLALRELQSVIGVEFPEVQKMNVGAHVSFSDRFEEALSDWVQANCVADLALYDAVLRRPQTRRDDGVQSQGDLSPSESRVALHDGGVGQ